MPVADGLTGGRPRTRGRAARLASDWAKVKAWSQLGRAARRLTSLILLPIALSPTLLAAVYYLAIASPQYVSEAHFIIRTAKRPEAATGFAALLQLGGARSQDDSFAVNDFIVSRDAVEKIGQDLNLAEIFGAGGADFLARYPSFLYGKTEEELYLYFQRMISVSFRTSTGITTLTAKAFRPGDARALAQELLKLSEQLVNRMNARIHRDAIKNSEDQVRINQGRLIDAQLALAAFRNRELMIDPTRNAVSLGDLIAKLSTELAQTKAQVAELAVASSGSPQLPSLRRRVRALEEQISEERSRIGNASDGLAERIATYDRLNLERDVANRMLTGSETELTRARSEARRQQLYLERVVEPQLPDYATEPRRLSRILTVFGANLILVLVLWLLFAGIMEHGAQRRT
jgi:capsular polysaccharide transport system permease protein